MSATTFMSVSAGLPASRVRFPRSSSVSTCEASRSGAVALISPILSDLKPSAFQLLPVEKLHRIGICASAAQRDVPERRRNSGNQVAYGPHRIHVEPLGFNPTPEFIVFAVTRNIREEQSSHRPPFFKQKKTPRNFGVPGRRSPLDFVTAMSDLNLVQLRTSSFFRPPT